MRQLLELRELGVPVPTEILIHTSTLQNKEELVSAIQQQEQQQMQQQQQQSQMQMEVLKAQIEDLKSRAMANEGLGVERHQGLRKIDSLAVERVAAAQKDRDLGVLDKIKAAKELTEIDLKHIERAIAIIQGLEERDRGRQEEAIRSTIPQGSANPEGPNPGGAAA